MRRLPVLTHLSDTADSSCGSQRDYYRLLEMGHLREALLKEGVEEARTMKTLNVQMNLRKVSSSEVEVRVAEGGRGGGQDCEPARGEETQ